MLASLYSRRNREDGFTLIELLIVVIIIGVLAAIALPIFINQQKAAYDARAQSDVRNTVGQVVGWQALKKGTPELTAAGYVADGGKLTISDFSHVGLKVAADGSYTVCGYNEKGGKYATATSAWGFDSTTGKSGPFSGVCENPVAGGGGGNTNTTPDADVPTTSDPGLTKATDGTQLSWYNNNRTSYLGITDVPFPQNNVSVQSQWTIDSVGADRITGKVAVDMYVSDAYRLVGNVSYGNAALFCKNPNTGQVYREQAYSDPSPFILGADHHAVTFTASCSASNAKPYSFVVGSTLNPDMAPFDGYNSNLGGHVTNVGVRFGNPSTLPAWLPNTTY